MNNELSIPPHSILVYNYTQKTVFYELKVLKQTAEYIVEESYFLPTMIYTKTNTT